MIIDLNGVQNDPFADKQYDVCICGAGVAGITLALSLSQKLNILLLEGGGLKPTAESQSIYAGEIVGHEYSDLTGGRLRFFGGTSNHWAGECRPLDSYDFEPKQYAPFSGWPIRRSDLDPYLEKAESVVELPEDESWERSAGYFEDKFNATVDFQSIKYQLSPPTRFGQKYRREIERRPNITLYLNANVNEFRLAGDLSGLEHVNLLNYSGRLFRAQARIFVLATGGIENPRIMLNSDRQVPTGLGNQNGFVGRFFTDHLYTKAADFILEDHVKAYVEQHPFGDSFEGRLKNQICNSEWTHEAVESIRGKDMDCLSEIKHFFSPTPELMERDRILNFSLRLRVRTPGHGDPTDGKLFIASEQIPNPLSRITLGSDVDRFGMRRVKLDWQISRIDLHTLQLSVVRFGETFADLNLGRLRIPDWLISGSQQYAGGHGNHHMCTTRMGESPDDGVVDANQKVFGTDNLYVAGSSIFSTGGHANPTLTIVQTTLRLADYISSLK
jgi:choline dehydrogenase-like flavoprotein